MNSPFLNPPETSPIAPVLTVKARACGVDYQWLRLNDEGDLFVTPLGMPYLDYLMPKRWYENEKYMRNGTRQPDGIGTVYRVTVQNDKKRKMDLVIKFSRFAQRTLLYTASRLPEGLSFGSAAGAHINNPFEEFGLLFKLRSHSRLRGTTALLTKRPLAIFSPSKKWSPDTLDRSRWRFDRSLESIRRDQQNAGREAEIDLDISREYILLFQWVKGENAWDMYQRGQLTEEQMNHLTARVKNDLALASFRVLDHKPQHIILRSRRNGFVSHSGEPAYALVDFEMLEFRPELV
jgi:hypothetical protein